MTVSRRNQVRPKQFQKFLQLPKIKVDLVKLLINGWFSNVSHSDDLKGKEVYITIDDQAVCTRCCNN